MHTKTSPILITKDDLNIIAQLLYLFLLINKNYMHTLNAFLNLKLNILNLN